MKILIFGSGVKNQTSNRYMFIEKFNKEFSQDRKFKEKYNEIKLFEPESLNKIDFSNLFELERYVSYTVDIILVFLESAGSIAELSSFIHDEDICTKIIIVITKELYTAKSFIAEGIIKHFLNICGKNSQCNCNENKMCSNIVIIEDGLLNKNNRQNSFQLILSSINKKKKDAVVNINTNNILKCFDELYYCSYEDIKKYYKNDDLKNYLNAFIAIGVLKTKKSSLDNNLPVYYYNSLIDPFKTSARLYHVLMIEEQFLKEAKLNAKDDHCNLNYKNTYKCQGDLKSIMVELKAFLVDKFKVHDNVYSYVKKKYIKDCVLIHKDSSFILQLDIEQFFYSITKEAFIERASVYLDCDLENRLLGDIAEITFIDGRLPVGFSTSPIISNIFMYELDNRISQYCDKNEVKYSRYSDDFIFSSNDVSLFVRHKDQLMKIITEYHELAINKDKTKELTKAKKREILGLVIANNGEVSIGRSKKKNIKNLIKRFFNGQDHACRDSSKIEGHLKWIKAVDTSFYDKLKQDHPHLKI